jgi:hypothetical protein
MLHSMYKTVLIILCIESDKVIMLKSSCGGLGICAHDTTTETGLKNYA